MPQKHILGWHIVLPLHPNKTGLNNDAYVPENSSVALSLDLAALSSPKRPYVF